MEHIFADHRNCFKRFGMSHHLCLFNQGVTVRRECFISFNVECYYCFDGTRGGYFRHIPPTLQVYLPCDEELRLIKLKGTLFVLEGNKNRSGQTVAKKNVVSRKIDFNFFPDSDKH